ncbi:hypothetical protein Adt_35129 [Abeliophyllum distichum]|uniref:Uncharacterized protein n=1 Tax=Abeliophyllum distichum TaxID=126358 RepID=A0ABD1QDV4_9LAMI
MLSVTPTKEVILNAPPKVPQAAEESDGRSFKSKKKLRELIGPPGARIPDDAVRNLPFYPVMEVLKSISNFLHLTKKLDDANAAQKGATDALEATNGEKRRLFEEVEGLSSSLEASENGQKEAESEVAKLLGEIKEMEEKLGSIDDEYVANFHTTEAYANFSDYFTKVGHQEVLAVLKLDYRDFNLGSLEARFLPSELGDEDDT